MNRIDLADDDGDNFCCCKLSLSHLCRKQHHGTQRRFLVWEELEEEAIDLYEKDDKELGINCTRK